MVWLIASVYAAGWCVSSVVFARHWWQRFGTDDGDAVEGAAWGMFISLVWPLVLPPLLLSKFARRFA